MAEPYDNPRNVQFSFPAVNFNATSTRYIFIPPNVSAASLRNIMVAVTTSFVGTATAGQISVDDGVTLGKYGLLNLGAAGAGPAAASGLAAYGSAANGITMRDNTKLPWPWIVGGSVVRVLFTAPTGGGVAGIADVTVDFDFSYSG